MVVWCTFYVLIVPMVSQHGNEEQCQIIPDYSHDFAGPAVETQLSRLFLRLFPIIPNYSYYGHNRSRCNGHSVGIQQSKKEQSLAEVPKTIALHIFASVSILRAGDGKKVWCFVVYAYPLQLGIIRIIKIIAIISIIEIISIIGITGIIQIISKILPEHKVLGAELAGGTLHHG